MRWRGGPQLVLKSGRLWFLSGKGKGWSLLAWGLYAESAMEVRKRHSHRGT